MNKKLKVYLAGPDVFREDAKVYGSYLKSRLKPLGLEGLYPFDNEIDITTPKLIQSQDIYEANIKMIKDCDIVLANLDRFRGPSCDVGTAFEIGYAKALNKWVIGYYIDSKQFSYKDIVIGLRNVAPNITISDYPYCNIEDFGLTDNLMISFGCDVIYESLTEALNYLSRGIK